MAGQWDTFFFASGPEALAWIDANGPVDVIVSDMRMPGMDGAQVLETVRRDHPATVRVILSGYAEESAILRTVGPAHLYLAKPCTPAALQQAIARPLALRERMTDPGLRSALTGLSNLPSLPAVYGEIEAELRSPLASARSVAAIIARDLAMTAELLRLTNSAYFSLGTPAATPLQALRAVGLETVQTLVLGIGLFRQFSGRPGDLPMLEALTRFSLDLAGRCEALALASGAPAELAKVAHCTGMLSHIGTLVLIDAHGAAYRTILPRVDVKNPLDRLEQETFGAAHGLIGAYLLGLWGFAPSLVEAVAHAWHPREAPAGGDNPLLGVLHGALALGPAPLLASTVEGTRPALDRAYLARVGLDSHVPAWQALISSPCSKGTR
ncbi:signal transduction protein [Pararhodospirillum oryzae]|uniref:Signal transduction protein n=2 Tax=Pararhodospirillum oryzae TaxID=478448 RepID=A0A512H6Q6_9PROT|nr:signal transduction protein [Pararhodospirillum oryzae]